MSNNIEMERKCGTFTEENLKNLNEQNLASCRLSVSTAVNMHIVTHTGPHKTSPVNSQSRGGATGRFWDGRNRFFTCEPTAEHTKFQ